MHGIKCNEMMRVSFEVNKSTYELKGGLPLVLWLVLVVERNSQPLEL